MKVGDLIRFSKWHTSRVGYEYCSEWLGLIYDSDPSGSRVKVYWVTGEMEGIVGEIPRARSSRWPNENASYEVISESR